MSALCLKTGDKWIHEEIPVISGKGTKWFTLFKFQYGRFNHVKVWFYHSYHVSLVNAQLIEDSSGNFRVNILEETELKKIGGRWNHGPVYYKLEDNIQLKLCC